MRAQVERERFGLSDLKENTRMFKRLSSVLAAMGATVLLLAVMPVVSASAAQPWWQVLAGSRPTHLWTATDNVQEIKVNPNPEFGAAIRVEVDGKLIGCLGAGLFGLFCPVFTELPATETSAELEALLEAAMGTPDVQVVGGPVGAEPFLVTISGREAPAIGVAPAVAEVTGSAQAKVISAGGSGHLVLTLTNLGNAQVDGTKSPVTITDELPEGVIATGVEAVAGAKNSSGPVDCVVEGPDEVVCSYEGELPPYEAIEVEVFASLTGSPPAAGVPGKVTVSGGNTAPAAVPQSVTVSPEPTPFGIEQFSAGSEEEGGEPTSQAGGHPYQFTTTIQLNSGRLVRTPDIGSPGARLLKTEQPALPRNVRFPLPAGLVGNATAMPVCNMNTFLGQTELINECADNTAIGVTSATVVESANLGLVRLAVPVFNLPPGKGEPARFGFMAAGVPVVIDTAVDPDDRYRITASVSNITQLAQFLSSTTTLWGVPGDPRHDNARGWGCVYFLHPGACARPSGLSEVAFMRQPVSCGASLGFELELEPWNVPLGAQVDRKNLTSEAPRGCNKVPFDPTIVSTPTTKLGSSSSGLDFKLTMPTSGLLNKDGISEGQPKKVEVALPEGMTINPSQAEGLGACSPDQYGQERFDSAPGEGCPEASKIGSVDIRTPLLEEEAHGAVYVAQPYDNPFDSLLALYMIAKIPERGILVKQAGKIQLDPSTGQIVTTFDDLPQVPFQSFKLNFFGGERAPLVMPADCGTYDIVAKFTPWNASDPENPLPSEVITKTSSFMVDQNCPSGPPPFSPGFVAGTENNAAGSYSPFTARLTRGDNEQEFTRFSMKLPKGVIGKLAGIPFCSDVAIDAARARTGANGGQEELEHPSCPDASQIGRTTVGAGVGPALSYASGKLYLAGPYQGAKLSVAAITPVKVGPFDLGNVVIRQALKVDPETAEVSTDGSSSDPIPHILQGVVTHARDIRIFVDRKDFVLNPTSCERMTADASVFGSGTDFGSSGDDQSVDVSSPFQAADCASLGFKPKLKLSLKGGTRRTANPKLKAVLEARAGDANIGRAQVTLPKAEFIEQSHFQTVCTRVQFRAGGGNGEQCPKGSIYGRAKAISPLLDEPLTGPVFLRSSDHELPDLVVALHSSKVDINLVGTVDSFHQRLRTTFETVPDAPVTRFVLEMQGGKKGLFVNSVNICKRPQRATADFRGQNGRRHLFEPVVKADCKGKKAKKSGRRG